MGEGVFMWGREKNFEKNEKSAFRHFKTKNIYLGKDSYLALLSDHLI